MLKKKITYRLNYRDAAVCFVKGFSGGISLSWIIFINENDAGNVQVIRHEYGHRIQSLILGWFYLIIVGLPSIIRSFRWRRLKLNINDYYKRYPENWANILGKATLSVAALFLCLMLALFATGVTSCSPVKPLQSENGLNLSVDRAVPYVGDFEILTQNMMLIPFEFVAPQFRDRTTALTEILENEQFNLIGLQEIFSDASQDKILKAWHKNEESLWSGIKNAREVNELAAKDNEHGIKIIDARPNELSAKISFGPYYVLGPDFNGANIFKQDSGLMILSRFPVIAASAFSFSNTGGTDRLANKGVLYARLKTGPAENDYIHFFTTHFQSHEYPESRFSNLEEMLAFVSNIILEDIKNIQQNNNRQGEIRSINPIIITGDINIRAFVPEGWAKKAGVASNNRVEKKYDETIQDILYEYGEQAEYKKFIEQISRFAEDINLASGADDNIVKTDNTDRDSQRPGFYLKDLWMETYPSEPGFTWMGKDWQVDENNPYGTDGNQYAIENGPPERIDYILFFEGNGNFSLSPQKISIYPENASGIQLSDHLGIKCSLQLVDNLKK